MLVKEMLIWKINTSIWFSSGEGLHLLEPQKAYPIGKFAIVVYMVTVYCFVWSLGLQPWSVSEWVSEADQILIFGDFQNNLLPEGGY